MLLRVIKSIHKWNHTVWNKSASFSLKLRGLAQATGSLRSSKTLLTWARAQTWGTMCHCEFSLNLDLLA